MCATISICWIFSGGGRPESPGALSLARSLALALSCPGAGDHPARLRREENMASCPSERRSEAEKLSALLSPSSEAMNAEPPTTFLVDFRTSKGVFTIEFTRDWAPVGVARVYNLVRNGFFDGSSFYRVLKNWVCQFGVSATPRVSEVYDHKSDRPGAIIGNDEVRSSNVRGSVSFSAAYTADEMAVNRTTELYINYMDNSRLDAHGFAPVGTVVEGMEVVESFYDGYGEMVDACDLHPEKGNVCKGVNETLLYSMGREYLERDFPRLDYILTVSVRDDACETKVCAKGGERAGLAALALVPLALVVAILALIVAKRYKRGRERRQRSYQLRAYTSIEEDWDEDDDGVTETPTDIK